MADKMGENTRKEYYDSVRAHANDIVDRAKAGEFRDISDVYDAVFEQVDGSYWVIYTHASLATLWFSDNWLAWDEALDEGIVDPSSSSSLTEVITQAAFFAFKADVENELDMQELEEIIEEA
jgi:hypothetical protein